MINVKSNPRNKRYNGNHWANQLDTVVNELMNGSFVDYVHKGLVQTQPAVNIIKGKNEITIEMAIPGLTKDQIDINVKENKLQISAIQLDKETSEQVVEPSYSKREFNYAGFKRAFTLPETINSETIGAKFENGLLIISLQKKEKVDTSRNIKIS